MSPRRKDPGAQRLTLASVETERSQFRSYLSINPNYFGNLSDSPIPTVKKMQANTTYEEIGCIGFNPHTEQLHATVVIKQPFGYGGGSCSNGTPEYVRFYTSPNGVAWTDEGVVSFRAYDVPEGTEGPKDLDYAVTLQIDPQKWFCLNPQFVHVRAILSWNALPPADTPGHIPVWGEVQETRIQIDKLLIFMLPDILKALKPQFPQVPEDLVAHLGKFVDLAEPLPPQAVKPLNVAELAELYAGTDVAPSRYLIPELQKQLNGLPAAPAVLPGPVAEMVPHLNVDIGALLGALLNPGDGNTSFEELECVGLNNHTETLVGVLRIKRSAGYSGGLCTAGSQEYVTFWVDRDNTGVFEFLGTGSVTVYDFDPIPDEGLSYAVTIPVDLDKYRPLCTDPAVWKVRAILSWNAPPSNTDPNWVPVWGNREEALVYVDPTSVPYHPGWYTPVLETVGGMAIPAIDSSGFAHGPAQTAGFTAVDSPFGGTVVVSGHVMNSTDISSGAAKLKYQLRVREGISGPWQIVDDKFKLTLVTENVIFGTYFYTTIWQQAVGGWYEYQEDLIGPVHIRPAANVMAKWDTGGRQGLWQLQLVVQDPSSALWYSGVVNVFLDNTAPHANVQITSGGGNCADFLVGDPISGVYSATDLHFNSLRLSVTPGLGGQFTAPAPVPASTVHMPLVRQYPGVSTNGESGSWTLDTSGMPRCGYNIWLHVYDRTIVDSGYVGRHSSDVVGFCLREPKG
jgi:hypothetical protein